MHRARLHVGAQVPGRKAIRDAQLAAGVPDHAAMTMVRTMPTRWGNQYLQLYHNRMLRLAIDPSVEKFKRDNKGEKEAIVETDDAESGSKLGRPVPASDIGLSTTDWEENQELEGFLEYAYKMKDVIERCSYLTGAQSRMLMYDLKENCCHPEASLNIKTFPASLSVADRECSVEVKPAEDLSSLVDTARSVLKDELQQRVFVNRPSNARLVQIFMTKQPGFTAKDVLTASQLRLAETVYLQMLRAATEISRTKEEKPTPKKMKVETPAPGPAGSAVLFAGAKNLPAAARVAETATNASTQRPRRTWIR